MSVLSKRLTEKIVVNDTEHRECVHTKATCHHKECKCSECPLTDLFCDEFYKAIDRCYEEAYASGCLAGIELGKTEYRDLEEQGLLLRLPCKVGDTFWELNENTEPPYAYPRIAHRLQHCVYALERLGKTTFLTQSEAEEKLRELEGK